MAKPKKPADPVESVAPASVAEPTAAEKAEAQRLEYEAQLASNALQTGAAREQRLRRLVRKNPEVADLVAENERLRARLAEAGLTA